MIDDAMVDHTAACGPTGAVKQNIAQPNGLELQQRAQWKTAAAWAEKLQQTLTVQNSSCFKKGRNAHYGQSAAPVYITICGHGRFGHYPETAVRNAALSAAEQSSTPTQDGRQGRPQARTGSSLPARSRSQSINRGIPGRHQHEHGAEVC